MKKVDEALRVSLGLNVEKKGDGRMDDWKSIYVMKASNNIIKIGVSNNVKKRTETINGMYPFNIIDVYSTEPCSNSYKIEKIMHNFFRDDRYFGEWFYTDFDDAVMKLKDIFSKNAMFTKSSEPEIDWRMSYLGKAVEQRKTYIDNLESSIEDAYEALKFRDEKIEELYSCIMKYEKIIEHLHKCIYTDFLKPDQEELINLNINQRGVYEKSEMKKTDIKKIRLHVSKRIEQILGGKQSEAYRDASIRGSVYSDIYRQLKREYWVVSSYKSIKRKYLAELHDFIDCYNPPKVLSEQIEIANAQISFGGSA